MLRLVPLAATFLLLAACGGGGGPAAPAERITYYVDVQSGSDANPGTEAEPFQTITHALAGARPAPIRNGGDQVRVLPGTYDASLETFPLVVPPGVNLLGHDTPHATLLGGAMADPMDAGNVTAAVVLRAGAQLGNLEITNPLLASNPGFHFGVLMAGDDTHVNVCKISGSLHGGVRVEKGTRTEIAACEISGHLQGIGIHFAGGGALGRVRLCDVHGNHIGIEYDAPGSKLNGSPLYNQHNDIHGNTHTDLWISPGIQVDASHNRWDHAPPTLTSLSSLGGGIDVFAVGGTADVGLAGAGQVTP